uniref:CID domain-containing protein n=1 Tax=Panagrolaimus sp. ES5 TaxID=591445 RepID=A0AC34GT68_9BILA
MSYVYPQDEKIKTLIDRIALNVALNGHLLSNHILQKEHGNPAFSFLIPGGEYNDYFNYQTNLAKQQQQQQQSQSNTNTAPHDPLLPRIDVEGIKKQIETLKAQVAESDKNVASQKHVLALALETQMEQLYIKSQQEKIDKFIKDSSLNITGLIKVLDENSYSQEIVQAGKHWIFNNCTTDRQKEVVFLYLLFRTKTSSLDSPIRLLIVYIADELAAYCHKKMPPLCSTIARYVPKFFAYASESRIPKIKEKLDKCLKFWLRDKIFDDKCLQAVQDPQKTLMNERNMEIADKHTLKMQLEQENRKKIASYEKQNADFAAHISAQIGALQATIENENRRIFMLTTPKEIQPTVPYFCLPAGVMVNMVKAEDFYYKPLKIEDIKVPNLVAPTERLTSQITRFYSVMPESLCDEQGWETDGLRYHYEAKNAAKKAMEEVLINQGKKLEDIFTNRYKTPSPDAEALRKTRFDIKPKEKAPQPAAHQFQYSYDDEPKESSIDKHTSSNYDDNRVDADMPDYSRSGFGSASLNTSVNEPTAAAPML